MQQGACGRRALTNQGREALAIERCEPVDRGRLMSDLERDKIAEAQCGHGDDSA